MKKLITIALTGALLLSLTACGTKAERSKYDDALELYESGKYASALKLFEEIPDYKDSEDYIHSCRYYNAMQTLSPGSNLESGYCGTVSDCTEYNASAYAQAVTALEELDGYKDSNRMLRDAKKKLESYQSEHRLQTILTTIEDQFPGYLDRCEYDGVNFYMHFDENYPITLEVVARGQTEELVAERWDNIRHMFADTVFGYLPECVLHLLDHNGQTLGTYMYGGDSGELTIKYDIATKPY